MNDHACILIWDAHTRMGHNIGPYVYGISHTRMGQYTHMGQNTPTLPYSRLFSQEFIFATSSKLSLSGYFTNEKFATTFFSTEHQNHLNFSVPQDLKHNCQIQIRFYPVLVNHIKIHHTSYINNSIKTKSGHLTTVYPDQ